MFFTSWSYFIEFLLRFKLLFTVLKNSNYFLWYDQSKSGCITGSLWKGKTKTEKLDYFIQNLSHPTFLKQPFSNFHSLIFIQSQKKLHVKFKKIVSKNTFFFWKKRLFKNFIHKTFIFYNYRNSYITVFCYNTNNRS